jgi:hypothetical protein
MFLFRRKSKRIMEPPVEKRNVFEMSVKPTSLFQKQRCIESLPTPLFQIIQIYSSETDYRNLVNTELSFFQSIKWETVKYSFAWSNRSVEISPSELEYKESLLHYLLNKVKDKSKQISIYFNDVLQKVVVDNSHFFDGIGFLRVTSNSLRVNFGGTLPFNIFDNIHHLSVENIYGSPQFMLRLRNVVKLEMINCSAFTLEDFNSSKTLKYLRVSTNGVLNIYGLLDNIQTISCSGPISCVQFIFPRNCSNTEFVADRLQMQLPNCDSLFDKSVFPERLKIHGGFPAAWQGKELTLFKDYPTVDLSSDSPTLSISFPLFNGLEISLDRFCLPTWNGGVLSNVKKLCLKRCKSLTRLPEMPLLEIMKLDSCHELTVISSLNLLNTLTAENCSSLQCISFCPQLKEVAIKNCEQFDLTCIGHLK